MIIKYRIFEEEELRPEPVLGTCVASATNSFTVGARYRLYRTDKTYLNDTRKVKDNFGKYHVIHSNILLSGDSYDGYKLALEREGDVTGFTTETPEQFRNRLANEKGKRFDL